MHRGAAIALLTSAAWGAAAQSTDLSPELLLLARIKAHMNGMLARQPNYTCLETIERDQRRGATRKFELVDTLRLEVALVEGKEMFAWPGQHNFQDTDLRNMVTTGAIGNGNFAQHARAVFGSSAPAFTYAGQEARDARLREHYDFRVPRLTSGYSIRNGDRRAVVGYHGSFWADAKTLDVLRLEVYADDIPVALSIAAASDSMDYGRMRIGEGDFLLPLASEMTITDLDGAESRNRVRLSACRQYTGESVISFGEAPPPAPAPAPPVERIELPAGLSIVTGLEDEIDSDTTLVGDPIRARVLGAVKRKGKVVVPKGAFLLGRVVRLERRNEFYIVGLEFSSVAFDNKRAPFVAKMDRLLVPMGGNSRYATRVRELPSLDPPTSTALFYFHGGRVRVPSGLQVLWVTVRGPSQ